MKASPKSMAPMTSSPDSQVGYSHLAQAPSTCALRDRTLGLRASSQGDEGLRHVFDRLKESVWVVREDKGALATNHAYALGRSLVESQSDPVEVMRPLRKPM